MYTIDQWNKILFLIFIFSLSGCSWLTDFAIINQTTSPINITYFLKQRDIRPKINEQDYQKGFILHPPKIIPIEKLGKGLAEDYPDWEYKYDEKLGIINTTIPSQNALWIDRIPNYGYPSEFTYSYMEIQKLIIKTQKKEIIFEGIDILKAFKGYRFFDKNLFVLKIKDS